MGKNINKPTVKRVLFLDYGNPFGGAQIYMGRLAQLLDGEMECYALSGSPQLSDYLEQQGVRAVSYKPLSQDGLLWKIEFLLMSLCLLPYLRLRYKVDILWVHGFREAFALPWAWLLGYRVMVTLHNTIVRSPSQLFYPYLLLFAHTVISVSRTAAESLPTFVSRNKIRIINNWVSSLPSPSTIQSVRAVDEFRLLYVGRLLRYKGASLLIDAFRKLVYRHPSAKFSLLIVGDGDDRPEFEKQAAGLPVIFAGFRSDPSAVYRDSDVFVNPTFGPEGSPLVNLEAMAHGLPAILSDLDVNREISSEGYYAKLFRRGDVDDLVLRIEELANSTVERECYKRRAYEAVQGKFSSGVALQEYRKVLLGKRDNVWQSAGSKLDSVQEVER